MDINEENKEISIISPSTTPTPTPTPTLVEIQTLQPQPAVIATPLPPQPQPVIADEFVGYDTIVIAGGSSKGLLALGALQYGVDNFYLDNVVNYVGTSSGAIVCYFISIGYSPNELMAYICTYQFGDKLNEFNIVSMINGGGAVSFSSIHEHLERMTIMKIGRLLNMRELKEIFKKNLIIVTYNFTKNVVEYLSADSHPNLPCLTALRMSSNLPLIFDKFYYNGSMYIDGGICDNFPIQIGDSIGKKILGLNLEIEFTEEKDGSHANMSILEFIYRLMFIPVKQDILNKISHVDKSKCDICNLSSNLKVFDFKLNTQNRLEMFSQGYQFCKKWMEEGKGK